MQDSMKKLLIFFCLSVYFHFDLSAKVTCAFLAYKKQWRNLKKNDVVFYIFDQLQVV